MHELYEIAIESTEVELLLTEGFADKTKQLILKAVKKIKEMIKKRYFEKRRILCREKSA